MRCFLLFACLSLFSLGTTAAVYSSNGTDEDGPLCPMNNKALCVSINMAGPIVEGDARDLQSIIDSMIDAGVPVRVGHVYLDSPGGDVFEAIKIGRILRENKIQALVGVDDRCYSSCTLVLAGAVSRLPQGKVGIHSFYSLTSREKEFDYSKEDAGYSAVAKVVESYLREMRIPVALLDEMMKTPASTLKILDLEEQQSLALFGYDPVFHQYLIANGYLK